MCTTPLATAATAPVCGAHCRATNGITSSTNVLTRVHFAQQLVLLPDNWTAVPGIAVDVVTTGYNANVFSVTQWNSLQDNGAVFLPAAGKRSGITMANVGTQCCYWSSYYSNGNGAYLMRCTESGIVQFNYASTFFGHSVRLVHDLTVLP